mmetsp:Transcript_143249/g.445264  ORF Transcript_143249/g.445264 Transcript_143249/m.445264 type:complete len:206 (+) Transcript_143249:345-962(+)
MSLGPAAVEPLCHLPPRAGPRTVPRRRGCGCRPALAAATTSGVTTLGSRAFDSTVSTRFRTSAVSSGSLATTMASSDRKPMMWRAPTKEPCFCELRSLPVYEALELIADTCSTGEMPATTESAPGVLASSSNAGQSCSSNSKTSASERRLPAFCFRTGTMSLRSCWHDICLSSSRCCLSNRAGRFRCGMWQNKQSFPLLHLPCGK